MTTAFAVTATAAYLIYFGLTVALHLRPSPYHPLSNTVSDYSRSMSGWMNRAAILTNGVGTALLLAVLHHLAHGSTARPALVELGVVAATRIAMAFVLADEPGQRRTAWGTSHAAIAILSFLAAVSAVGGFTRLGLFRLSSAAPMQHLLAALALPLLGVLLVTVLVPYARRFVGLAERLFLLDVNGWLLVTAIWTVVYSVGH